jgi:hypothetical protein
VQEVTKAQFQELRFHHDRPNAGWTPEYWNEFFEPEPARPVKHMVEPPKTPEHDSKMIVVDKQEYRMFFLTEDEAGRL